jgi:voltage-gated potassium channel
MHKTIVKLSYKVHNASGYQKVKSFFRSLLTDKNFFYKKYFDYFMIFLILLSTFILIVDETTDNPGWLTRFDLYIITSIFALEYLLRLWISQDLYKDIISADQRHKLNGFKDYFDVIVLPKLQYLVSFPALIDLVAIFPKFRVVRLLKLYHYLPGISTLFTALSKKRFEFIFLGYLLLFVPFLVGSLFYLLENETNKEITSYLDAIYWAMVTITTVGYGDITPVTDIGKIIAMFSIVFGVAMISFTTSIMVSAFSERFDELRNIGSIKEVHRMKNVILINGYGHLGKTIAQKLENSTKYDTAIIENDEMKAAMAHNDGFYVIKADGSSARLIEELIEKDNVISMLTLRSNDIDNIYFILNAKSIHQECMKSCKVFARMNQTYLLPQYLASGVDGVLEPYSHVDTRALRYIKNKRGDINHKAMIFGYTHKSKELCRILKDEGISMLIYENIEANQQQAIEDGYDKVFFVDFERARYLEDIPFASYKMIACAMNNDALNVYHAISLRSDGYQGEIVALSDSKEDNRKLKLAGVTKIFDMYEESAVRFIEMIDETRS